MLFNNNLERLDVLLDEGMFKVLPNPGLNLTHLRTTGPREFRLKCINGNLKVQLRGVGVS